ncbi:MAG: TolC family protein, partial [Deltaproteobacteria bacterium]
MVNGIKVAYLQDDIAYEQYRMAVGQALYGVKTAFYGILLAEELVRVRTESLEVLERHHETTLAKYDVGLVSRFDVLRSEVELANARPPLIQAKNDLKIARENLKRILGVDVDEPFGIEG